MSDADERIRQVMESVPPPAPATRRREGSVARCDYCGGLFPIPELVIYWRHAETLDDGTEVKTTGIYCGDHCGELSSSRAGTVRG